MLQGLVPQQTSITGATVSVDSPLSGDTRQQPFAANLLDLQLRGEGAPDGLGGCRISRLELAIVSGFFSGLATHQQPAGTMSLPVGHAGVQLLVEAVYTKQVQLDGESVVDLLQAASYLQVKCCLDAARQFLLEHALKACPEHVLRVAESLGLQGLIEQIRDCLAGRFASYPPRLLARALNKMGTEMAVQLLQRDDLCCPLECFVVEVLLSFAAQFPDSPLKPLLDCVRWTAMTAAEVKAAVLQLQGRVTQGSPGAAEVMSRLAEVAADRQDVIYHSAEAEDEWHVPEAWEGEPRVAASRTLQLRVQVVSSDSVVACRCDPMPVPGVGEVYIKASPRRGSNPARITLYAAGDQQLKVGLRVVLLSMSAAGQVYRQMGALTEARSSICVSMEEVWRPPLCSRQGGEKMLLVGCYIPDK
ncbi:hypothetical protein N2152v2_010292 [Parachlorella kessleri]